jgi:hypothetical protein
VTSEAPATQKLLPSKALRYPKILPSKAPRHPKPVGVVPSEAIVNPKLLPILKRCAIPKSVGHLDTWCRLKALPLNQLVEPRWDRDGIIWFLTATSGLLYLGVLWTCELLSYRPFEPPPVDWQLLKN